MISDQTLFYLNERILYSHENTLLIIKGIVLNSLNLKHLYVIGYKAINSAGRRSFQATHTHWQTQEALILSVGQMGAQVTAVLLFSRAGTPGNQTVSVSKDTVTDLISEQPSDEPEWRGSRAECRKEEEDKGVKCGKNKGKNWRERKWWILQRQRVRAREMNGDGYKRTKGLEKKSVEKKWKCTVSSFSSFWSSKPVPVLSNYANDIHNSDITNVY